MKVDEDFTRRIGFTIVGLFLLSVAVFLGFSSSVGIWLISNAEPPYSSMESIVFLGSVGFLVLAVILVWAAWVGCFSQVFRPRIHH